jgi:hypothetical protein
VECARSVIFANVWRGMPFVAISLLAGLQTISPSLYEAAAIDGATPWQMFRFVTLPLLTPIIAVVMTFSVLFTFTDFQLIYVLTRGGPVNATHLMATLSFQRAIRAAQLGEGAASRSRWCPSCWRHPVQLLRPAAPPGNRGETMSESRQAAPHRRRRAAWTTFETCRARGHGLPAAG